MSDYTDQTALNHDEETRRRFLDALRKSQWLSKPDMDAYQRRLLERVVRHAHAETDYYRQALSVLFTDHGSIDWRRWQDVPVLSRETVQAKSEMLFARSVPKPVGQPTEIRTSGSTGRPIRILWDRMAAVACHMLDARFYDWHGIETGRSLAIVKSFPKGAHAFPIGSRSSGWHALSREAAVFQLNTLTATIEQQIEWLDDCRPDYLTSYPSNLLEIARTIGSRQGRALGLKACFSFGETVSDDMRSIIENALGAPLLDRYGSTEVGQISAQCHSSSHHHVSMENVYLEILDEDGRPAQPGEPGRVVVTGFYQYSMPFIRYDVGDYAILSQQQCSCGRNLDQIERIVGRARSLFRFNDGSSKFPFIKLREILEVLPHRQLQMAQTDLDRVEVRYVPETPDQLVDEAALTRLLRQNLHPSLTAVPIACEAIDRSASGKFFDYLCELGQP